MTRSYDVEELARRVLEGDESVAAARALEAAVLGQRLEDERLDDLMEALSLYAPGSGRQYYEAKELREVLQWAMPLLCGDKDPSGDK
ncbi:MAG: hypothetical protein QG597_4744 [Actinomycetota bacterium]|nr:hypothetical protein [Actinomycetota bacterium]